MDGVVPTASLPVLMYHSVSHIARGPRRPLAVPAGRLTEQLETLADAGYTLLGLTDALARRQADRNAAVIAITFDDGFRDFLTSGLRVLSATGARATLYVAAGHVGRPAAWLGKHADDFAPLLTWDVVREVAAAGVEIGSHGLVHTPMDVLPERVVDVQVRAARERLRQHTQTEVASFAYPHGYHTRLVRASVAHHGHLSACEAGRRLATVDSPPFAIPRLPVTPDHGPDELLELVRTGGPQLVPRVRHLARPAWRVARRVANGVLGTRIS
jgi:peptidoglycan/xylan/chitin deacetylase (PgdA/CDA1 family)